MELRNLWDETAEVAPQTKAPDDLAGAYDLAVIGGGFAGVSAALHGQELGARVAVFEAETIGYGGSGRNVGLVNAGLWTPPDEIDATLGAEAGARLYESLGAAPDRVFELIKKHQIACEATRHGTLHCAHSPSGLADLRARCEQLTNRGAPVQPLDRLECRERLGTSAYHGALFDPRAGTIQPLSYCRGLARAAINAGGEIYERAPVTKITAGQDGWTLAVMGREVAAKHLLIATNAYQLPLPGSAPAEFTRVDYFQATTAPLDPELLAEILPLREGCWDTAQVMTSFRLDAAGRMILGGVGSLDSVGRGAHLGWAQRKLRQLFPQLAGQSLEMGWSGRIAMTSDHIPKVIQLGNRGLAVFGYSGRGIGPGTVFGAGAAKALLAGDTGDLPVAPQEQHSERFTSVKAMYYESGAALTHLMSAR